MSEFFAKLLQDPAQIKFFNFMESGSPTSLDLNNLFSDQKIDTVDTFAMKGQVSLFEVSSKYGALIAAYGSTLFTVKNDALFALTNQGKLSLRDIKTTKLDSVVQFLKVYDEANLVFVRCEASG